MARRWEKIARRRIGAVMSDRPFDDDFTKELGAILRSTVSSERFDSAGNATGITAEPFTGNWILRTIEFEPGTGRTRVTCHFAARTGDHEVVAKVDAGDFQRLIGKRSRDPRLNSSRHSDLAVLVSIYIEEQILTYDPSDLAADEVRIAAATGKN
jgi:hypothetical protein